MSRRCARVALVALLALAAVTAQARTSRPAATPVKPPKQPKTQVVKVSLYQWGIKLAPAAVKAGPVTFQVRNDGTFIHALAIEGTKSATPDLKPHKTATLKATLKRGSYTLFCPVAGHRQKGMATKLTVK